MDIKKLIRDFPPAPYEEKKGSPHPIDKESADLQLSHDEMWSDIRKREADKKLREDAIDARMQKSSVNAGQYGAVKKERNDRTANAMAIQDERDHKRFDDHFNNPSEDLRKAFRNISQAGKSWGRGHGKAMTKRINDWKVK